MSMRHYQSIVFVSNLGKNTVGAGNPGEAFQRARRHGNRRDEPPTQPPPTTQTNNNLIFYYPEL